MNQTRMGSLIEAAMSTAIGLIVSVVANQLIFPRFGFHPSLGENITISFIYTGISIARQSWCAGGSTHGYSAWPSAWRRPH